MPGWSVNANANASASASASVSDENDGRGYRHESGRGCAWCFVFGGRCGSQRDGGLQISSLAPLVYGWFSMENGRWVECSCIIDFSSFSRIASDESVKNPSSQSGISEGDPIIVHLE